MKGGAVAGSVKVREETVAEIGMTGSSLRITYHSEPPTYDESPGVRLARRVRNAL